MSATQLLLVILVAGLVCLAILAVADVI